MVCAHISYSEEVHILGPFCVWGGHEPIETLFPPLQVSYAAFLDKVILISKEILRAQNAKIGMVFFLVFSSLP